MRNVWKGLAAGAVALGATALVPSVSLAQAAPGEGAPGQPQPLPVKHKPENTLNVHGTVNVGFGTDYISRGLVLENQGLIVQPSAELRFTLFDNANAPSFGKGEALVGIWNSIHSENEFSGGASGQGPNTMSSWYEFDWYFGGNLQLTPEFGLNVIYQEFLSPSDSFGTCKNIQATLSYNDSKLWANGAPWEGFGLNPYAKVLFEVDGKCGTGSDEGTYLELGIAPAYTFKGDGMPPVTLSVPITVGLGFSDFYGSGKNADGSFAGTDDELFGFASVGVVASVPLNFMSEKGYGNWTLSVGGFYYYLGDGVTDFNDVAGASTDSEHEFAGTVNLTLTF